MSTLLRIAKEGVADTSDLLNPERPEFGGESAKYHESFKAWRYGLLPR